MFPSPRIVARLTLLVASYHANSACPSSAKWRSSALAAPALASLQWKSPHPPATSARSHTGCLPTPEKPPPHPNPPAAPDASPESDRKDTPPTPYFRRAPCSVPCETILAPGNSPSLHACPNRPPNSWSTAESRRGSPHKAPTPHNPPRWSPTLY